MIKFVCDRCSQPIDVRTGVVSPQAGSGVPTVFVAAAKVENRTTYKAGEFEVTVAALGGKDLCRNCVAEIILGAIYNASKEPKI